jgi:fibronectin type 3 domain-containing protein
MRRNAHNHKSSRPATAAFEMAQLESRMLFSVAAPTSLLAASAVAAPASIGGSGSSSSPQVSLNWQDNSANETAFQVVRSGDGVTYWGVALCAANSTSYVDSSVAGGYTYYYKVRGISGSDYSDYSNMASATTPRTTVPLAPTNLTGTLQSSRKSMSVALSWQDNSSNEDMFVVQRSTDGINWITWSTLAPNTTSYTDTAISKGQSYSYRVMAYNSAGGSAWSNIFSLRT